MPNRATLCRNAAEPTGSPCGMNVCRQGRWDQVLNSHVHRDQQDEDDHAAAVATAAATDEEQTAPAAAEVPASAAEPVDATTATGVRNRRCQQRGQDSQTEDRGESGGQSTCAGATTRGWGHDRAFWDRGAR